MRLVLSRNPDLAMAKAGQEAQKAELAASRKDLFPTLSASYAYTRQPAEATYAIRVPENYYTYAFSVEQPVFKGRALVTTVEKNRLGLLASEAGVAKSRNDVILAVHDAYFSLLRAEKLADETRQAVARLEGHRRDAENFHKVGLISRNDLLANEVELAQGKQNALKAENLRRLAASRLNLLMKQPVDAPLALEERQTIDAVAPQWEATLATALANRPELRQARIEAESADADIVLARARFLPEISLVATYLKRGDSPEADFYPIGPAEQSTAQAVARWRLWSWGQSLDKVEAARKRLSQFQERLNKLTDAVTLDVRQAFLNLEEARASIEVARAAVGQAEENHRINQERYLAQVATNTEVLDSLTLLAQARLNLFNAVYGHDLALSTLRWASATLDNPTP
ncbi:MAG: TolC family protein [Thermodesulfobacteriota bacterium]